MQGQKVGAPLVGRVCPCSAVCRWVTPGAYSSVRKAIQEAMWAHTWGLEKAEILQDTRSCVVPRPSDEGDDAESSHRASERFFHVYVDNLGVWKTSRVNVDKDLMMALQTLKKRGLDTHEEVVHWNTATALGIHTGLRNMLVTVAPMRLWQWPSTS